MRKRSKMNRRKSKGLFRRSSGQHKINRGRRPGLYRGGIRL